jgi:tRNA(Ile)-lysidine synthase
MLVLSALKQQLSCEPLSSAGHVVVAYSGGVDSHVLLHAIHNLKQQGHFNFCLSAIHIHHGLSQHADHWQTHCQHVCATLDIEFQTANVNVQSGPRQSLEAQAREARYNKLVELAPANSQVLLGQHQDDQLETFLLQLKRGAGPKGLSAMNRAWASDYPSQPDKQVGFYRPLLDIRQQAILDYAQQHNLKWCEDESNQNTYFERNFLRHDVLPILQNRWPEISRSVARSAALCAEQQGLLDEICDNKLKSIQASANSLHLSALQLLSQSWLHQLVRYWLSELGIQSPSLAVLNQLKPEVLDATEDATPILQWNGWQFRRFNQMLFVIAVKPLINKQVLTWNGGSQIDLPSDMGTFYFRPCSEPNANSLVLDPKAGDINIQFGGYSQRFTPKGAAHSKPLKQWFKQWQIPPWVRNQIVLLKQNEQLLGILMHSKWLPSQHYIPATGEVVAIEFISPSQKGNANHINGGTG